MDIQSLGRISLLASMWPEFGDRNPDVANDCYPSVSSQDTYGGLEIRYDN